MEHTMFESNLTSKTMSPVKAKLSLWLSTAPWRRYRGVDVKLQAVYTSTLDGNQWSSSRSGRFTPWKKSFRYPLLRRMGGPQSRSGRVGQQKINPCLYRDSHQLQKSNTVVIQTALYVVLCECLHRKRGKQYHYKLTLSKRTHGLTLYSHSMIFIAGVLNRADPMHYSRITYLPEAADVLELTIHLR